MHFSVLLALCNTILSYFTLLKKVRNIECYIVAYHGYTMDISKTLKEFYF